MKASNFPDLVALTPMCHCFKYPGGFKALEKSKLLQRWQKFYHFRKGIE